MATLQQIGTVVASVYLLGLVGYIVAWGICIWRYGRQDPPRATWPIRQKFPLV